MSYSLAIGILFVIAIVAANLPWLSERIFFIKQPRDGVKPFYVRLLEWFVLYFIVGAMALGLEQAATGQRYEQGWEFYVITACLFLVFAFPGFIYRYDLKRHLQRH
ncbi:DUF2818 family protein [Ectothiorhodospiraceae bacterium 2226]|nr:DUF2818 family protein [Ectothiorhodospiraceae bacterium 2226]